MKRIPMYPNLEAEIARRRILKADIAKAMKISYRTFRNKTTGVCDFTWPEVNLIQHQFFPDVEKEYLFATDTDQSA